MRACFPEIVLAGRAGILLRRRAFVKGTAAAAGSITGANPGQARQAVRYWIPPPDH